MTEVTLRICGPGDGPALRAIAERDSAREPAGAVLAAEIDGELVAAISLRSRRLVADPFRPTADAVELLRRRADQIGRAQRGRRVSSRLPLRRRLGGSAAPAAGDAG